MNKKILKNISIGVIIVAISIGMGIFVKGYFFQPIQQKEEPNVEQITQFISEQLDLHSQEQDNSITWYNSVDPQYQRLAKNGHVNFNLVGENEKEIKENINNAILAIAREIKRQDILINTIILKGYDKNSNDENKQQMVEIVLSTSGIANMAKNNNINIVDVEDYCLSYQWS